MRFTLEFSSARTDVMTPSHTLGSAVLVPVMANSAGRSFSTRMESRSCRSSAGRDRACGEELVDSFILNPTPGGNYILLPKRAFRSQEDLDFLSDNGEGITGPRLRLVCPEHYRAEIDSLRSLDRHWEDPSCRNGGSGR
jgi:hypothetical protein